MVAGYSRDRSIPTDDAITECFRAAWSDAEQHEAAPAIIPVSENQLDEMDYDAEIVSELDIDYVFVEVDQEDIFDCLPEDIHGNIVDC